MNSLKSYRPFIEFYLNGIMTTGLLKPLCQFAAQNEMAGSIAESWYRLQLEGQSPQAALKNLPEGFPLPLTKLLTLGFEKSSLDLVLTDVLKAFDQHTEEPDLIQEFTKLEKKYQSLNMSVICAGCADSELEKIISRAKQENADEVLLEQHGDFLVQKYIGPKLVTISEASIPAVYSTLLYSLKSNDFIQVENDPVKIEIIGSNAFVLAAPKRRIRCTFS